MYEGNELPVIFLDIEKAYDKVWHEGLLYKLKQIGVTGKPWQWIMTFIQGRQFRVTQDQDSSDWYTTTAGVPQGTVLSPLLFLIYIDDMNKEIPHFMHCNMFADDVALWPDSKQMKEELSDSIKLFPNEKDGMICTYRHILQMTLTRIERWAIRWKVTFSQSKTNMLIFSAAKPTNKMFFELKFKNNKLMQVEQYQYLGIVLCENGRWNEHEEKVLKKAKTIAVLMRKIMKYVKNDIQYSIQVIHSIFYATVGYAIPMWYPSPSFFTKCDHLLGRIIKSLLHLPISTCTESILIETRSPLTKDYRITFTINAYFRTIKNKDITKSITKEIEKEINQMPLNLNNQSLQTALKTHRTKRATAERLYTEPWIQNVYECMAQVQLETHERQEKPLRRAKEKTMSKWLQIKKKPSSLRILYNNTVANQHHSLPLYMLTQERKEILIRAAFRFDRVNTNAKLHSMGRSDTPHCPHCTNKRETLEHILIECKIYNTTREETKALGNELGNMMNLQFILAPEQIPTIKNKDIIIRIYNITNKMLSQIYNMLKSR